LEFLALLINGEFQRMPLPRAPISQVLATTRLLFGSETIGIPIADAGAIRCSARHQGVSDADRGGMYNGLLSAPFPFVLTQSFTFPQQDNRQGLLQRQHVRMANAGDFAVSQAEELVDALDALTSNEFVMGDHHFTLQVLADAPSRVGDEDRFAVLNDASLLRELSSPTQG